MEGYHIQTAPTTPLQPTPAMKPTLWLEIVKENVCQVEIGPALLQHVSVVSNKNH